MKQIRFPLMLTLIAVILFAVACQEDTPADGTVTPPIVPAPTGESDSRQAYPPPVSAAPDAAYPAPEDGGDVGSSELTPETPSVADPGDGGDGSSPDTSNASVPPVPVEPEIRSAAGSVQSLPEAGLIALPSQEPWTETPGSTVQHTVSVGEWLLQIARCYGTSATAIRSANNLGNPNYLTPGSPLTVPDVGTAGPIIGPPCVFLHVAAEGETWESIAFTYETTPAILQRANPGPLAVGRELFVPATPIESIGYVPVIDNHLLFISNGNLAIWRATDSRVELVPDNEATIVDVATNRDGRFVLARQTRDDGATSEMTLIDTESRTSLLLESGMAPYLTTYDFVEQMLISPDGGWGVFASRTDSGYRLVSFQTAAPDTLYVGPEIPFSRPGDQSPLQLFPGQDSTRFLVSSARGLHEFPYSLDLTGRELVGLTGDMQVDPVVVLFGLGWDPSGRYLLANGGFLEGGAVFVIDGASGELVQLPGSNGYVTAPGASWAADGTAIVIEPTADGTVGPRLTSYLPASEPNLVLSPVATTTLEFTSEPRAGAPQPGYVILTPVNQFADGTVTMAIQGDPLEQGVWETIESGSPILFALESWPDQAYRADWTWDLSGVLATVQVDALEPNEIIYVPLDGQGMFDLSGWVTGYASDFHWLVPR